MATPKRSLKSPRVTVTVELETIFAAEQRSSSHCMIADAIKLAVPTAQRVSVDLATIRWTDPRSGRRHIYLTPHVAQVALVNFDKGEHTEPFRFQLRQGISLSPTTTKPREPQRFSGDTDSGITRTGGGSPPLGALSNVQHVKGSRRRYGLKRLES
jgi:hypothetical protein